MIKPKFICNDCEHKPICKYENSMCKLIQAINTTCTMYDSNLPIDLSAMACYHFQPRSINNSGGVIK